MNWKDFLSFNRRERYGITVFAIVLIIVIISPYIHEEFFLSNKNIYPEVFKKDIVAFENHLNKVKEESKSKRITEDISTKTESVINLTPFQFNPNDLSGEKWLKLGLPERIVRTIKNFQSAGGSFRFKEDLKRIYGITDQMYNTLEPYIELPSRTKSVEGTDRKKVAITQDDEKPVIVDINSADSLTLLNIRGIGPAFSSRIIRYRHLLGGFTDINQLKNVYGFDKERFESIKSQIIIKDTTIQKININEAGYGDLIRHPYINRNLANNILQIRQQHGKYSSINDIKKSHLIDEDTFIKLFPYLTVDH